MADIINFDEARPKPTFKEKIKSWWSENKDAVFGWATFIGVIVIPIVAGISYANTSKSESVGKNDFTEYETNDDDDYRKFEEEVDSDGEMFIQFYDSVDCYNGSCSKTISVETDYTKLGYLGEKIVKNFDIDTDELPCVTISFETFNRKNDSDDMKETENDSGETSEEL